MKNIRKAALAVAALAAALSVTACQGDGSKSGAEAPSKAPSSATASPSSPAPGSTTAEPDAATSTLPAATASPVSEPSSGTAKTCAVTALEASAYEAADRPAGTGTGAAIVEFKNTSAKPCILQGHPTVAGAGNGSPQHNAPLKVTRTGSASPVRLAPGAKAWLKLTFVQVQGEADGYCESGSEPVTYPTMVIGLPNSGAHQVALDDGVFAECDNKVTATAVSAKKPS